MNRFLPSLLLVGAVVGGVAVPAAAAAEPTIELHCAPTSVEGRPGVHCDWDSVEGAAAYRVIRVGRRHHGRVVRVRRTTETAFEKAMRPGRYRFVVQAVDGEHHVLARSDRERVRVG
jgi:hypothetical protein